ncbi:MAG: copper-binding protein [Hyphomonadaceae bacterium]
MFRKVAAALMIAALAMAAPAPQAFAHEHHQHAAPQAAEGEGVVRRIDMRAETITVAHEPIPALNWPAMVMAFPVQSRDMLTSVSVGARVHFVLVNHEGHPMLSQIRPLPAAAN